MDHQIKPGHFFFTSENVAMGHPDKLCDYISDSILDTCLEQDPKSRVAVESAAKNNLCMVFGEISTTAQFNIEQVVRKAIKEVGYNNTEIGMNYENAVIIVSVDKQSGDIFQCLDFDKELEQGAGDQGLMIGYATDQTEELMPLSHQLCSKLIMRIEDCKKDKIIPWMRPDAKVQVTVEYKKEGSKITPLRVDTILISCQHNPDVSNQQIRKDLKELVIQKAIEAKWLENTKFVLNPSGKFIIGGPTGDAGLTGRKVIADTYGGWGGHGGGCFSGKDASKVDRSGAYAVRWIAKSLVANKFCKRAMVQVSYSIGLPKPLSIFVDSYGTVAEGYTDQDLIGIIARNFDLRPGAIIRDLKLRRPIFKKTAWGCHFGRFDPDFTWQQPKDLKHERK